MDCDCLCLPIAASFVSPRPFDPSKRRRAGRPNQLTINPGWNDIPSTQFPAFLWPLECPDDIGGFIAAMEKRNVAPAAAFLNNRTFEVFNLPGFYGCALPFPGDWKVHYGGATALQCVLLDDSNPASAVARDPGCYAVPQRSTLAVTAATQVAMAANPFRDSALFVNDSVNVIWLQFGAAAVANEGIRLNPGGSYEMSRKEGNLWRGSIRAISNVAGPSNLTMLQGGIPVPT